MSNGIDLGWPVADTELETDPVNAITYRLAAAMASALTTDEAARDRVEAAALVAMMLAGETDDDLPLVNEVFR